MGRKATGSKRWNPARGYWEAVATLQDGTRAYVPMKDIPHEDKEQAKAMALLVCARLRSGGGVKSNSAQTVNDWFKSWVAARVNKGLKSTDKDESRFRTWISPRLGTFPIAKIARVDIERFVLFLDAAVRSKQTSWKNASNVWGVLTKMMGDASASKVLSLRVREDDPSDGVEGPDRGDDRAGTYLYPSEFSTLMRCAKIPVRRRRMYALATYLYLRGGELEALTCGAVDLAHGLVSVHTSVRSRRALTTGTTKSGAVRLVPLEAPLRPLLVELVDEDDDARVTWTNHPSERAWQLRLDCQAAGLTREALYVDDESRRPLVFHDLRATGITWRAVRGDGPMQIQAAAGHVEFTTTQGYVREALAFPAAWFGTPFPELPSELWDESWKRGSLTSRNRAKQAAEWRPQGDSNPR